MSAGAATPTSPAAAPGAARLAVLAAATMVLAAAVRLSVLGDMEASNPLFRVTVLDEAVYLSQARRIRAGALPDEPSLVSLFWPWILAHAGAVERHAVSLLNVGLGAVTAGLAAAGAARLGASLAAGVVTGAVCALSGGLAFQDTTLGIESLLGLLVLASCLGLAAAARRPTRARLALAGLAIGAAVLGRGTNAALLLGALPALRGAGLARGALRALTLAAAAALPVAVFDLAYAAVPTSAGINLWLGNNPYSWDTRSFGTEEGGLSSESEARFVREVAERAEGRALGVAETNAWWLRRTRDACAREPGRALGHLGVKTAMLFSSDDTGGNHDSVAERQFSAWLRTVPVALGWVLALGAGGWIACRRSVRGADSIGLALAGCCAALVLIFPLTRYRTPLVPAAAVLVGAGAVAALRRTCDRRTRAVAGGAAAALLGASFLSDVLRPPSRPESWTNLGQASFESGVGDAEAYLRRAVEDDDAFPAPMVLIGYHRLSRDDPAGSVEWFRRAQAASRLDAARWTRLERDAMRGESIALSRLRRFPEALACADAASARFPDDAELAADSAVAAASAGDRAGALRRLEKAKAIDAAHPRVVELEKALR